MTRSTRLNGALVDTNNKIGFSFNGQPMTGYEGDTLASALIANGQKLVARSFKYHRPRGIFSAGSEEPNALVTLHSGAASTPNSRATMVKMTEGLEAFSQNHRGSLKRDLLSINDLLSPFLGAGFYYKTFMWPAAFWERFYEPVIRQAAGLGALSTLEDPERYGSGHLHCDLLVIGSGPAGLMAALTAGRAGASVILADEDFLLGGRLNSERISLGTQSASDWAAGVLAELRNLDNVQIMPRTTVFGTYDHGIYGAFESRSDAAPGGDETSSFLWRIYASRTVLAAGATERSIAFPNNDRPGIMLSGAVRSYVNRWGVSPGKSVAVLTNNNDGWRTAEDLRAKGVQVAALIDTREGVKPTKLDGVEVLTCSHVINTKGRRALRAIQLASGRWVKTDCLAVAGGWNPNVHLTCHHRGRPVWNEAIASFVPGSDLPHGMIVAGAAKGRFTLSDALQGGSRAAQEALAYLGMSSSIAEVPKVEEEMIKITAFWHVPGKRGWVDLQNDVTAKDVKLAHQEGYRSVEHVKRYTTMGMATDQGKTSNLLGMAVLAEARGQEIAEVGTTIFRPPYTPIPIGALAGSSRGKDFRPVRLTPSHKWAEEQGAVFVESGAWMRAQWFPKDGETHWRQSVDREVLAVRSSVGICDVSTLGKIDLKGRDVATLLDRLYANKFAKLAVGKTRYGLMLREDGVVMDDGTTARLSENHYVMTTTTANAGGVFQHMEFCLQGLWPELDVHLNSTTDGWAQFAVAGPQSRDLLRKVVDNGFDLSNEAFPFMACAELSICSGTPARLFRVSFSGELAYELAVPARFGDALVRKLMELGSDYGVTPYGTEALNVMRIEKGHAGGNELNGQTTALNLGMEGFTSKPADHIGRVLAKRPGLQGDDQVKLVGFVPVNPQEALSPGSHFLGLGQVASTENDQGWLSSVAWSPVMGHSIGLGFLKNGSNRLGEVVRAWDGTKDKDIQVKVVSPHFYDHEGGRQRG